MTLEGHWDNVDSQRLLSALPQVLVPGPDTPRLEGPLSAWVRLSGSTRYPSSWIVEGNVDTLHLRAVKNGLPFSLQASFVHQVTDSQDRKHSITVGPVNPSFVPLDALPAHVVRAVTLSEDAGFFAHRGFDFAEIKNSLLGLFDNGKTLRGGSTITQQLAKNLFLSKERTYARKVKEAILALVLESSVSKRRLLEIYLNIIEWGPGLYGLGPAARHYFGRQASELTPKEAAFLASIIPNPVRYYVYFKRGELTDTWQTRVNEVLQKLLETGVIDQGQIELAMSSPLMFRGIF